MDEDGWGWGGGKRFPVVDGRGPGLVQGEVESLAGAVVPELRQYDQFMRRTVTHRPLERKTRTSLSGQVGGGALKRLNIRSSRPDRTTQVRERLCLLFIRQRRALMGPSSGSKRGCGLGRSGSVGACKSPTSCLSRPSPTGRCSAF